MSVLLGTLVLNELEWLPRLYEQHRDWPDLAKWVFVEASDAAYADANPDMVSDDGLSVDSTTEFLKDLARRDDRVVYVPYGRAEHADRSLCKIGPRNAYWKIADEVEPGFVVSVDADEFYTREDQGRLADVMRLYMRRGYTGFTFPRREIWRPPSIADQPLFAKEVVGGFWGIPCCHWWVWSKGAGHRDCHNTPQDASGKYLNDLLCQLHRDPTMPQMIHLGFASQARNREAKRRYYEGRGEIRDRQRRWYCDSRAAWNFWEPGDVLPRGAKVVDYLGPIPECFR